MIASSLALMLLALVLWPDAEPDRWPVRAGGAPQTGVRPGWLGGWSGRARRRADRDAAESAELIALGLDAGLPLPDALVLAEASGPRDRAGAPALDDTRTLPDGLLATAVDLSTDVGAPLAHAARIAAEVLRQRARAGDRLRALTAGPRASMYLLTALPIAGPVVVVVLGMSPQEVYAAPLAIVLVVVGLVLTAIGWLVSRAILRRAARPTVLTRPAVRTRSTIRGSP